MVLARSFAASVVAVWTFVAFVQAGGEWVALRRPRCWHRREHGR